MAQAAIPLAIVGGGLAAGGTVMAGREEARATLFEDQQNQFATAYETDQLKRQEQEFRIAAAQTEARRREELTSSLETIAAIRAGRGVGEASPTAAAIYESTIADEERDIRTERLSHLTRAEQTRINYLTRAEQQKISSQNARRKAKFSLLSSYVEAGANLAKTGASIASARAKA